MYTVHKADVPPFKSRYLGGMELMVATTIKGPQLSRRAFLEMDD